MPIRVKIKPLTLLDKTTTSRNLTGSVRANCSCKIQIDVVVLKLTEGVLIFVIQGVLGIRIVGIMKCYRKRLKMKRWKSMIVEYDSDSVVVKLVVLWEY